MPHPTAGRRIRPPHRHAADGLWLAFLVVLAMTVTPARAAILDDFEQTADWSASASPGVRVEIAQDDGERGMAMRLDFDFQGTAGYVVARKEIDLTLPENYAFTFQIRGDAPENNLEIKLVDPSGQNVWWSQHPHLEFGSTWRKMTVKKRHFEFAWGPDRGPLGQVAAIEIAITAGRGGKGSVWIDQLTFVERDLEPYDEIPTLTASTSAEGSPPEAALDNDPTRAWHSGAVAEEQWLQIDFGEVREYGGLVIDWDDDDFATTYQVQVSDDQQEWREAFRVEAGNGGRDYIYLPETDSRHLRIDLQASSRGAGYAIRHIEVKPYRFATTIDDFFGAIAQDSVRGSYPRYYVEEQSYWTVVGVPGDHQRALIDEAGRVEPGEGWGAIEPFLYLGDQLLTWDDVETTQTLEGGHLPIPSITWQPRAPFEGIRLEVTALAAGAPGASNLWLRYRVSNDSPEPVLGRLFLALRPFRVNPPWQSLTGGGGAIEVQELVHEGRVVAIDRARRVVSLTPPDGFGAARFEDGGITEFLRAGRLPEQRAVYDGFGYATGALQFGLDVPAGESQEVFVAVPLHDASPPLPTEASAEVAAEAWAEAFGAAVEDWQRTLDRVAIELPGDGGAIVDTLRTTLGHIMINADGPALQPGPRAYKRSWIRDGALISAALLRFAHPEPVRHFIHWYAQYQFEDGGIPCCVDWRGADLAVEHDSHGQWIYLLAEYYRFTRDVGLLAELWPSVVAAVEHIDALRQKRRTVEYDQPDMRVFYGLVPESISHEGYIQNPVHAYWDDFFVLLGLKDAVRIATILGEQRAATAFGRMRDEFRTDLYASIEASMERHGVPYIPGAAELGDFDFTSTAIAVAPVGEIGHLPEVAFAETFEEYYRYFEARRADQDRQLRFERYTPYEFRIVGPLIELGRVEEAHEILDFLMAGQRPAGWHGWAEVVWRDPRVPGFIGDMPHTWVGAEFVRSVRTMIAYERELDQALVVGAGLRPEWLLSDEGVRVRRLPTHHGTLNFSVNKGAANELVVALSGDVTVPPGGIVLPLPIDQPLVGVTVNERVIEGFAESEVVIHEFPASVVLHYPALPTFRDGRLHDVDFEAGGEVIPEPPTDQGS